MINRPDRNMLHEWHVAINKSLPFEGDSDAKYWIYSSKRAADELPRLMILFKMEREELLSDTHKQCSQSKPEQIKDNHLTCCLGVECRKCPHLISLEATKCDPEQLDFIKAWTCVTHILVKHSDTERPMNFDDSEGYVLTRGDRMFWDNVYSSMAQE